jgi:hypothetical protein
MLGYNKDTRVKIGISKNVTNRIKTVGYKYGGLLPSHRATFAVPTIDDARKIESLVIQSFPQGRCTVSCREILDATPQEIIDFILNLEDVDCVMVS